MIMDKMKTTLTLLAMLGCGISAQAGWINMPFAGINNNNEDDGFPNSDFIQNAWEEDFIAPVVLDDDYEGGFGFEYSDDDDNQQPVPNNNNNEEDSGYGSKSFATLLEAEEHVFQEFFAYARNGNYNEVLDILLRYNIDVDVRDEHGYTALLHAAGSGHLEVVQLLIDNHADVNATADVDIEEDSSDTALHLAATDGHLNTAILLINNGADVNLQNGDDGSALHLVALGGHFDIAELLINRGANINLQNEIGYTALHVAAMAGRREIVELLLNRGADVGIENVDGETALELAIEEDFEEIIELLEEAGGPNYGDFYESDDDDNQQQPELNNNNNDNPNPGASWGKVFDEFSDRDSGLLEAWFNAARDGDMEVIRNTIIDHEIDVNIQDEDGYTALHFAAEEGHLDIVKLLIDRGSDVNLNSCEDGSALHLAALSGRLDIAQFLIEKGADLDIEDCNGDKAIELARQNWDDDMMDLLKKYAK